MTGEAVLYEAGDVAHQERVSIGTVRNASDAGELPVAAKTPRGLRLFRPEDAAQWGKSRRERGRKRA